MIPRLKPWLGKEEFGALFRGDKSSVGRFEKEFAKEFQSVDAVAFPYGRSALWAFLKSVGIQGAEVVMPAYTCSVVAHAISLSDNTPVFVDICDPDYNMDLTLLSEAITERTRAVVATHLFGYPMDIDRVEAIITDAEARYGHKIWLIQDCAHSFGASWEGRMVGTSGDVALYGLNISKMMTSIFGGMLTFQDQALADKVRAWRDSHFEQPRMAKSWLRRLYLLAIYIAFNERIYGITWWLQEKTPLLNKLTKSYHLDDKIHFPPDYLDRMLPVEAEVGLEQLKKYPQIIARRRAAAEWYNEHLVATEGWSFPPLVDGATYSHYVVTYGDRQSVIDSLADKGIQLGCLIEYSVPELNSYASKMEFEVSSTKKSRTINLPVGPYVGKRTALISDAFNEEIKKQAHNL
ncbi:DegT/DnrJ/EryC1/StrS family aminotransferase [Pseudomonadota bacterium]